MKSIVKHSVMFIIVVIWSLFFLRLANDYDSYWINVSWAMAVWFGIETVLYLEIIKEWKQQKKI